MLLRLCITTVSQGIGMTAINKTIKTDFPEERVKTAYRKCYIFLMIVVMSTNGENVNIFIIEFIN